MFVRRNTRKTWNVMDIKAAGGDLLLYKEERIKKSKKMTTNRIKVIGSVKNYIATKSELTLV